MHQQESKKRPKVVVIDNDSFYLTEFKAELSGKADVLTYEGPNEFEACALKSDIENANLIVIDFKYKFGNAIKSNITNYIRDYMGYKGKLILYSHMDDFGEYNSKVKEKFDAVMHKKDLSWVEVNKYL